MTRLAGSNLFCHFLVRAHDAGASFLANRAKSLSGRRTHAQETKMLITASTQVDDSGTAFTVKIPWLPSAKVAAKEIMGSPHRPAEEKLKSLIILPSSTSPTAKILT